MIPSSATRLIIASSPANADLFYATHFCVPDPVVFLEHKAQRYLLLSSLEIDRGKKEATVDHVLPWGPYEKAYEQKHHKKATYIEVIYTFLQSILGRDYKRKKLFVPESFPLGIARQLEQQGVQLQPVDGLLYPERERKNVLEIKQLHQALRITEAGMERGIEILRSSRIGKKKGTRHPLLWRGVPLTSERLRCEIETTLLQAGGIPPGDSVVAGGQQACDPHEQGHGPLYAHELIVLDLFPRHSQNQFYGDMTRTVLRGQANDAQRHLWQTCLAGQKKALQQLRPGAKGEKIHQSLLSFFAEEGYPTEEKKGRQRGFFHGTGHGLGLELHEEPRFGKATLKTGNIFTIEPGLYIPEIGGVRHEDVIVITETGYRCLTRIPKRLEL